MLWSGREAIGVVRTYCSTNTSVKAFDAFISGDDADAVDYASVLLDCDFFGLEFAL